MFGIYPESYNEIQSILERFSSIKEVVIYGSRAKGNFREGSDIDLTVLGDPDEEDINKLWHDLDESYIPYKFDISIFKKLKSDELKEHIKRVGKTFYKSKKLK
jgi:predicted nucleotidyltransferase